MEIAHNFDDNFINVKTLHNIIRLRKFNIGDIKNGLKYTVKLSLQLNDDTEMHNLFHFLFINKPHHHIA